MRFPENAQASLEKFAIALLMPSYAIDDQAASKLIGGTIEMISERNRELWQGV